MEGVEANDNDVETINLLEMGDVKPRLYVTDLWDVVALTANMVHLISCHTSFAN